MMKIIQSKVVKWIVGGGLFSGSILTTAIAIGVAQEDFRNVKIRVTQVERRQILSEQQIIKMFVNIEVVRGKLDKGYKPDLSMLFPKEE